MKNNSTASRIVLQIGQKPRVYGSFDKTMKKPKPKKYPAITFRISPQLHAKVNTLARILHIKKSEIVKMCIEAHLPTLLKGQYDATAALVEAMPTLHDPKAPNSMLGVVEPESQSGEVNGRSERHPSSERKK